MNFLNTDCLIEIVKWLNLKDQISLHQVNSDLQEAVIALWRIKYKHVHINFYELNLSNEEFAILLNAIQNIVETLQLRFITKEKYEILKEFQLPRVNNFRFTVRKPYFLQDSDLRDFKNILPNLKTFSPHGNFSGLHMDQWPLMKDLNLSFCFKLEMPHFQTIMSELKLEKLKLNIFPNNQQYEELNLEKAQVDNLKCLELNTYEFYYFLAKPLLALKKLIITNHYNPTQLFDVILSIWEVKQIRLVETANVDNILVTCMEMYFNVEQLTIVNDRNPLPSQIIPSLNILTNLRKLRFKSCTIKSIDIRNLLQNTPQLEEINFEHCQFDTDKICLHVEEVVANRSQKLRLNMFENRRIDNLDLTESWIQMMEEITYVSVDLIGKNSLLELSTSKGKDLCYEPLYIVFK